MAGALPDEMTIRRYLLGRLDASPKLVETLDDRMLSDAAFSEMVGAIEDEIIEEYLDGTLDLLDRQAVEKHFLRPPERRQKLRLARKLNEHLAAESDRLAEQEQALPPVRWPHWRTLIEVAAAAVVVVASALYIVGLRHGFQAEIGKNQHELLQEHERSAQLTQQLENLRNLRQPPTVLLSLLQPGVRGDLPLPDVEISPTTRQIHIEVRLQDVSAGPCDVRLVLAGDKQTIWSKSQIQPLKSQDMALLVFDLPTNGIKPGKYELFVRRHPGDKDEISYSFEVKAAQ